MKTSYFGKCQPQTPARLPRSPILISPISDFFSFSSFFFSSPSLSCVLRSSRSSRPVLCLSLIPHSLFAPFASPVLFGLKRSLCWLAFIKLDSQDQSLFCSAVRLSVFFVVCCLFLVFPISLCSLKHIHCVPGSLHATNHVIIDASFASLRVASNKKKLVCFTIAKDIRGTQGPHEPQDRPFPSLNMPSRRSLLALLLAASTSVLASPAPAPAADTTTATLQPTNAWVSVDSDGAAKTITPVLTTISGTPTVLSAKPTVSGTASSSEPPEATATSGAGSFPVCSNLDGAFAPFCAPSNGSTLNPGATYYGRFSMFSMERQCKKKKKKKSIGTD